MIILKFVHAACTGHIVSGLFKSVVAIRSHTVMVLLSDYVMKT